jgi:competence protein ComEA
MKHWQEILLGVFLGFLFTGLLFLLIRPSRGIPVALLPIPTSPPIQFYIVGSIQNPGVYAIPNGSRISDAIVLAGGLLPDADPSLLDLAGFIQDGERIWIPPKTTPTPEQVTYPTATLSPPTLDNPLNINTATEAELELLPGIGPVKAQQIVDYRQQNGLFLTIEELKNVPGISDSLFDTIKGLITVLSNE